MPPLLARFRQSVPDQLPATGIAFRDVHSPNLPVPTLTPTLPHHKAEKSTFHQHILSTLIVGPNQLKHRLSRTNTTKSQHSSNMKCPITLTRTPRAPPRTRRHIGHEKSTPEGVLFKNAEPPPVDRTEGGRCAPEGTRTPNLLNRNQMLYPLSYGRFAVWLGISLHALHQDAKSRVMT